MPLMSSPCRACNDPELRCLRHPPDALPLPNPFYYPDQHQHIQHGYRHVDTLPILFQAPNHVLYPQEHLPHSNGGPFSGSLGIRPMGATGPYNGAYMLPGSHPLPPQPVPHPPSAQHSDKQLNAKRKNAPGPTTGRARKVSKRVPDPVPLATAAGIGPSTQNERTTYHQAEPTLPSHPVPPTYVARSNTKSGQEIKDRASGASDVWIHVQGVNHHGPDLPSDPEEVESAKQDRSRRAEEILPSDLHRPDDRYSRVLCLHCLYNLEKWKTWANSDGGVTSGIRAHMEKYHGVEYTGGLRSIGSNRVNNAQIDDKRSPDDAAGEAITPEGLARYIAELVADQDLAFNIVQARTFRRLLCYVGQGNIRASDIPERRTVAKVSSDLSQQEKERLKEDMHRSRGRVSLTSDLWTDDMERPFMAITSHYINAINEDVATLMAFRVVEEAHTGSVLAKKVFEVLKEYEVVHKIGSVTLDNASNNSSMMEELTKLIRAAGYDFDKEGNRIHCFPHIINLAVTAFMDALGSTGDEYLADRIQSNNPPSEERKNYISALQQRPDKKCRDIVVALRRGQRRAAFRQTILEGNEKGHFKQKQTVKVPGPEGGLIDSKIETIIKLRVLELILDVPTRWSSTRHMMERFDEEYPAIWEYLNKNKEQFAHLIMSDLEFRVLQDILACLNVPHRAQELLSAERTPTLSLAFPVYDQLIYSWRQLAKRLTPYAHAIECGVAKIQKYVTKSRSSAIHVVAMVLNPCIKYTYIDARWTPAERKKAREIVKRFMLQHLEARELRSTAISQADLSTEASRAQGRGINNLFLEPEGYSYNDEFDFTPPQSPEAPMRIQPTPQRPFLSAIASSPYSSSPSKGASLHRTLVVDAEHERYVKEKLVPLSELGKLDLVKHWTRDESKFSLLHAVAMDALPAQASSVSSERVFSSSKLTCTRARNRMNTDTVESLQILKYALRNRYRPPPVNNTINNESTTSTPEMQKNEGNHPEAACPSSTLDLMVSLGDADWSHDAILDADVDSAT